MNTLQHPCQSADISMAMGPRYQYGARETKIWSLGLETLGAPTLTDDNS